MDEKWLETFRFLSLKMAGNLEKFLTGVSFLATFLFMVWDIFAHTPCGLEGHTDVLPGAVCSKTKTRFWRKVCLHLLISLWDCNSGVLPNSRLRKNADSAIFGIFFNYCAKLVSLIGS